MYNNRRSYTTTHDIDHFEPEMELVIAFKKFKKWFGIIRKWILWSAKEERIKMIWMHTREREKIDDDIVLIGMRVAVVVVAGNRENSKKRSSGKPGNEKREMMKNRRNGQEEEKAKQKYKRDFRVFVRM
jgi:hypothetical protein